MRISDWSSDVCSSDLRGDGDQPVGGLFDRLAREAVVDDVVERDAAPAMDRLIEFLARAERGDRDRHLPLGAGRDVRLEPVVRFMDDLVDRVGRRQAVGIVAVPCGKFLGDLMQPFVEERLRPRVERRKTADDARLALCDDQFGSRYDEQWRSDDGQAQAVENRGKGHESVSPVALCNRSEEHTSELQSLMRISYAVFCLKKKKIQPIKK